MITLEMLKNVLSKQSELTAEYTNKVADNVKVEYDKKFEALTATVNQFGNTVTDLQNTIGTAVESVVFNDNGTVTVTKKNGTVRTSNVSVATASIDELNRILDILINEQYKGGIIHGNIYK